MPKVAQSKPAESVRVQIRLSPEKSAAVLASVESLGIVNLTSACNYLLNKGLEQSSSMANAGRAAAAVAAFGEALKVLEGVQAEVERLAFRLDNKA